MQLPSQEELLSAIPTWRAALIEDMKTLELELAWDREVQRRIVRRKTTRDRATARREQARARRLEAKALYSAASAEYQQHLKQQAELKMIQEQEKQESMDHGIIVDQQRPPDIVRDIQWVYDNWGELFTRTPNGTMVLVEEVLEEAPSNGAIAMATYAVDDPRAFFRQFVSKLIPKDAAEPDQDDDKSRDDKIAELDPSFEDMKEFFNMDVAK